MKEENCRRGRKRHKPVSSSHVRASSKVSCPRPFWRILSERDASSCSAVKEKSSLPGWQPYPATPRS